MDKSSEEKMFGLLDVIATGVQDLHGEIGALRNEMHEGFARVDRRFGNVETRLESLESSRA